MFKVFDYLLTLLLSLVYNNIMSAYFCHVENILEALRLFESFWGCSPKANCASQGISRQVSVV